jgi:hypothetical protein
MSPALDQPVGQRGEGADAERLAGEVDAAGVRIGRLGERADAEGQAGNGDRNVDEEHPAPARSGDEGAADRGTEPQSGARQGGVEADGADALPRDGERRRHQGQARRGQRGAPDPLQRPADVELRHRGRQAAQQRAGGEQRHAEAEQPLAAEPVGERPAGQQQRGERQRVCIDHPLDAGESGVQPGLDGRQRGVHDREVEEHHEEADAADGEGAALVRAHVRIWLLFCIARA